MEILVTMPETGLRETFFPSGLRARLESLGRVSWNSSESNYAEAELRAAVPGVDVLITGWGSPKVSEDVLAEADSLGLVAHTGGSVAETVSEAVYDAGIPVVSANDVMADHTAEHALTALLSHLRSIPSLDASMHRGEWANGDTTTRTLHGKSVGLVGLGTIGRKLLDHFSAFDPSVSVYDPYVDDATLAPFQHAERNDLRTALDSEVVSVHAARTPETVGMLDADRLAQIPDGAVFVNTARAEIVEEPALLSELRDGRISAVLDVYHEEPLPEGHELRSLENVLLTPHVGGSQIRPPLTRAVLDDVERYANGDPLEYEIPQNQWETMTR
jgi:phosphoglycerate dehydrogenase-like enzyme